MIRKYDRLITFDSTHQALQLESILDTIDIDFDIRPIPPALSAGCGLAIEFHRKNMQEVQQAVIDYQIISKAMYEKVDKLYHEI